MKRLLTLILASILLLSAALPLAFLPVTAVNRSPKVTLRSPAIPADAGETIDLRTYAVEFSETESYGAPYVAWSSDEVTILGGTVTAPSAGVYPLTATAMGKSKTVYLVVKDAKDTEYLLYEEDFNEEASPTDLGLSVVQKTNDSCTVTVTNGSLVLSGQASADNYIRVLLPAWLGDFADYKIDTVAAMTASEASNRWASVMFRVQENNYPYYQLAIRYYTDAANGTELALRTVKDAWDVQYKAPYTERFSDNAFRTLTAEAYGSAIRTSIDGTELAAATGTNLNAPGRIGFQVRGCELSVDHVRVSLQLDDPENTASYMAVVEDPESNVILPPSVVTEIRSAKALESLKTALIAESASLPATAIFTLDDTLKPKGLGKSTTVAELLTILDERVIPAFRIESDAAAVALAALLKNERVNDAFVLSSSTKLLKFIRKEYPNARAVLDVSAGDPLKTYGDLGAIRSEANACGARVILLPEKLATKENVDFLQRLLMTVWSTASNTETARVRAIVSGANGVVSEDYAALAAAYTKYFREGTLVRMSSLVGHRGVPSLAPENTVEGSMVAYEKGATIIENDVYLSRDGVVFVMHDGTIDRTTSGVGSTESFTYEELKQYVVDTHPEFGATPIPTLEDYLKTFKGLDVQLFIEIKSSNTAICQKIADLINQYDFIDQANVISFNTPILTKMKEVMPEISLGYLTGTLTDNETDPTASVEYILKAVQTYGATYNPSYNGGATLGPNLIRAANHRGITLWPWTINDKAQLDRYFLYGTHGITTNYMQYVSDCVRTATTEKEYYRFKVGTELELPVTATTYGRETSAKKHGTLVFIEGDDVFTYQNGKIVGSAVGKATVMLSIGCMSPNGNMYYLCTSPFTVEATDTPIWVDTPTVTDAEDGTVVITPPADSDPSGTIADTTAQDSLQGGSDAGDPPASETDPEGSAGTTDPENGSGCGSALSLGAMATVMAPILLAPALLRKRRH